LEELDVNVRKEFDRSLFQAITKHCGNLRKLYIKAKYFIGFGTQKPDWTFLARMTHLRDFQIRRQYSSVGQLLSYGDGPKFLQSLPREQMQRLSLKGIDNPGFWKTLNNDLVLIEPDLELKLDLLRGFRNLKQLSFLRCGNAVDDQVMQFIFREMTTLQKFEISHCYSLTDAGIAGNNPDSVSIQNLIGNIQFIHKTYKNFLIKRALILFYSRFSQG